MTGHTEDEARTKWCPFARAPFFTDAPGYPAVNRQAAGGSDLSCSCVASLCMAWRWVHGDPKDAKSKGGIMLPPSQWPGYCGLAGGP